MFANEYQDYLRKYIELKNGVPSHDTLQCVMGMLSPDVVQQLYSKWQEFLNREEGETLKKIICIDEKTMRSNSLKSIGMEKKTLRDGKRECVEYWYYISSLPLESETFRRAVRGHWSIESMHWHLDVTFREDGNQTYDKQAVQNLNIIRKWSLSILKMVEIMKPGLSMRKKRFAISLRPIKYLEEVLSF